MKNPFQEQGEYYGYPPCCIEWFTFNRGLSFFLMREVTPLTSAQEAASDGKGFIPCPICAERIASGEIKIQDLIKNRQHHRPYPYDVGDEENDIENNIPQHTSP